MKKTFSVNLGNRVYNIDDDAYLRLKEYLDRIESYFSDEKEREEIINDIEIRLSELFAERLSASRQVITLTDVEDAIRIMGDPSEIGGAKGKSEPFRTYERSGRRRLYRDPDNRVFGGVCGGLGAYLNVDPVILRVILVVLFFAFGVGLLVYLIMWIVVPEARTTAQKLEMRGDPVNASNIGNFFREEFDSVKKSFKRKK
ncbi:MAG TPA: PspC domain-containing protein [Bacteroidales bacterium]|jgi:phage shock protein PspC (stress-responsive transcriptional regulator)|nr:PspC domain-containing protein [Bacteroidales bacterium]